MSNTKEDPALNKRRKARKDTEAKETAADLSIAERLTRASKTDSIIVHMNDEDGEFEIELREPLISERVLVQRMLSGFGGQSEAQEQAEADLAELLATHSIDPSLDTAFWLRAEFTPTRLQNILMTLLGLSEDRIRAAQEVIAAQSFRKD